MLVAVFLHVHTAVGVPHTRDSVLHGVLVGVHEFRIEPGDLHDFQQGFPEGLQTHTVQVMFGLRVLLRVRQPEGAHRAVQGRAERPLQELEVTVRRFERRLTPVYDA